MFFSNLPNIQPEVWFNSEQNPMETAQGKLLLIDFFTYSCVNCIRTFDFLHKLYKTYEPHGLVVVGVHTPEFEFEKIPDNLQAMLNKYKIAWPVIVDNTQEIWQSFANKYWPTKYLVSPENKILSTYIGEGKYLEIENKIRQELGLEPLEELDEKEDLAVNPTPETYLGYHRGKPAQIEPLVYDIPYNFAQPDVLDEHRFALSGQFILMPEYVESINFNSTILLHFNATEVNLVVIPTTPDEEVILDIKIDDKPLFKKHYGKDLNKNGQLVVTESRMYNIVKSNEALNSTLTIKPFQGNFRAFAFTFGGY